MPNVIFSGSAYGPRPPGALVGNQCYLTGSYPTDIKTSTEGCQGEEVREKSLEAAPILCSQSHVGFIAKSEGQNMEEVQWGSENRPFQNRNHL